MLTRRDLLTRLPALVAVAAIAGEVVAEEPRGVDMWTGWIELPPVPGKGRLIMCGTPGPGPSGYWYRSA